MSIAVIRWSGPRLRGLVAGGAALGLFASAVAVVPPATAEVDPSSGVLDDVPGTSPSELGDADLTPSGPAPPRSRSGSLDGGPASLPPTTRPRAASDSALGL